MFESASDFFSQFFFDLIVTFVSASAAYVFGRYVWSYWKAHKFGGWNIIIIDEAGDIRTDRAIGWEKAEEILDDESEMSVFIKGIVSFFGWLRVDPLSARGRELGLLNIDREKRTITVDLQKNPPEKGADAAVQPPTASLQQEKES